MKKIAMVCLSIILVLSMSAYIYAEPGGFLNSPSLKPAPTMVSFQNENVNCVAQLIITAYADRAKLPTEAREKLEEAYKMIADNPDLSVLHEDLVKIAADLGVKVTDLAVSDLFDISTTDCNNHADHGHFDVTLKSDVLKNFACLLHYYNGQWRIVKNAEVTHNGEHLEFDEDEFSPFAIVVNTATGTPGTDSPATHDFSVIYAVVAAVSALGLIVLGIQSKKQRA